MRFLRYFACLLTMASSKTTLPKLRGSRSLEVTPSALTTTQCNTIRSENYEAELQLVYEYLVEFRRDGPLSLTGIENAIAHAVAQDLDTCDALDRPLYKVKATTQHTISKTEFCAPQNDENTCSVVIGVTEILLDSNSASVQEEAYELISAVLGKTDILSTFAPSVERAQYLEPVGNTLIFAPEPDPVPTTPGAVTATIAVAAASVSFLLASIFCYGVMRREMRNHPEPSVRHKNNIRKGRQLVSNPLGIRDRQHSFVRLEDFVVSPAGQTSIITSSFPSTPQEYTPSITWSISDITSDSASLRSNVSRRTSNLERIEEEVEENEDEYHSDEGAEDDASGDSCQPEENEDEYHMAEDDSGDYYKPDRSSRRHQWRPIDPIKYTAKNFFQGPSIAISELHGCQFVDDRHQKSSPVKKMQDVEDGLQLSPDVDDHNESDDGVALPSLSNGDAAWNAKSPKIGTDEDSVNVESLKQADTPQSSFISNSATEERPEGQTKNDASVSSQAENENDSDSERSSKPGLTTAKLPVDINSLVMCDESYDYEGVPESHISEDCKEDQGDDEHSVPSDLNEDAEARLDPHDEETPKSDDEASAQDEKDAESLKDSTNQNDDTKPVESGATKTPEVEPYDTDDERPWIGIATGDTIIVIDDSYDYPSECPTTPRSEVYDTEYFETPRQYESSPNRSRSDAVN